MFPLPSELLLSGNNACLDRQLVDRAGQCFPGDLLVRVAQLEEHATGLDVGNPPFRRALTGTHAGFRRLLGQRSVREDVDPHLAATLDVPVDGDTSGLDLPVGEVGVLQCLDAVVTEAHRGAATGNATLARVVLLAVLYLAGNQHDLALRALCRFWGRDGLGCSGRVSSGRFLTRGATGFGARRRGARGAT